jgi:hypothetical protein
MRCPPFNDCDCNHHHDHGHQGSQGHQGHRHNHSAIPRLHCEEVPYYDGQTNTRTRVRVVFDIVVTKLAGLERWRFIVPIHRIEFLDHTPVRFDGMLKTFVRLKYSQQHSMFDARQAFISYSPVKASHVEVTAERVSKEENGDLVVFFTSFTDTEPGLGMSKATVTATSNPIFVDSKVK